MIKHAKNVRSDMSKFFVVDMKAASCFMAILSDKFTLSLMPSHEKISITFIYVC